MTTNPAAKIEATERPKSQLAINCELEFSERLIGDHVTYVGYDPIQNRYFHFGVIEREAFQLLREGVVPSEIPTRLSEFGVHWDEAALSQYIMTLTKWGIVRIDRPEVSELSASQSLEGCGTAINPSSLKTAPEPPSSLVVPSAGPALKVIGTMLCPRIPLFAAGPWVAPWMPMLSWLFSRVGIFVWLGCVLSALWLVWQDRVQFGSQVRQLMSPHYWPWFIVLWFAIKVVHEAGHAICAKRHGVRLGDAGLMLFMGAPMFFVDVTDAWKLKRRRERVMIAMGGVYLELLIASLAVWFWVSTDDRLLQYAAAQVILLAGPATLFVNANPLLRLDGYYALSDLANIPNLRMHGRRILGGWLEHIFLARPLCSSLLDPWRTTFAMFHAACSILFQFFWMTGLIIGVTYFAGAIGLILAACALLLWVIVPCTMWITSLRKAADWPNVRPRFYVCAAVVLGGILLLGAIPSPFARRVPAVVRYRDEELARAAVDGFVKVVHTSEGKPIKKGELLVELEDPELRVRRDEMAIDLEVTRMRIHSLEFAGNAAMASAERERAYAIERQLSELNRQIQSLGIRASRDGVICSPGLNELKDRFVKKGQVLAVIADENEKELVTSIAPGDIDAYLHLVKSEGKGSVRLRGGEWIETSLEEPKPRFSDIIPHPALAATAGGPLAISDTKRQEPSAELRTTLPRCRGISNLDSETASKVRSGQQGVLFVGDTRSLWERVGDWVMRWMVSEEPI